MPSLGTINRMDRQIDPSSAETVAIVPQPGDCAPAYMPPEQVKALIYIVIYFAIFSVLLRFGLVAMISAVFFINSFSGMGLGLDWTTWYAPYGLATMVLLLAIAGAAFWRSPGAQDLLGNRCPEPA